MPARVIGPIPGSERADAQIDAVVNLFRAVLGAGLQAIYLYGSAVNGGLRRWSDLDLLVLTARSLTGADKRRVVDGLLRHSSVWPEDPGARIGERMLEVTVVAAPEVVPWRFPPRMELQYGEWLRRELEAGDPLSDEAEPNADLALLIEQARRDGKAVVGPPPRVGLPFIPPAAIQAAILAGVDELLERIETDTSNVILTLARMWLTLVTGEMAPKDVAAIWAIARIATEDRPLLDRARSIYLGEAPDRWPEPRARLDEGARRLAAQVRLAAGAADPNARAPQRFRGGGEGADRAVVRHHGAMSTDARRLPRPAAILFDLDGTLVDTVQLRIEAWARTFQEARISTDRDHLATLIGVDGKRLAREVAAIGGKELDDDRAEAIDKRCGEIFAELNVNPRPLPGASELVAAIEQAGIAWAIATSSRREQVERSVEALRLRREPTIVDGSHVEHAKPEPDLLLLGAKEVGVEPTRCWYVGDSTWDITAAIAAGMIPIGVTAGAAVSAEVLAGAGAAVVVPSLDRLIDGVGEARA